MILPDPSDNHLYTNPLLTPEVTPGALTEGFGEDIHRTLDMDTWQSGEDLAAVYSRIEDEIREAVHREGEHRREVRRVVFPRLASYPGAPKGAGVHTIRPEALPKLHRGILFNGGIEACDGRLLSRDSP